MGIQCKSSAFVVHCAHDYLGEAESEFLRCFNTLSIFCVPYRTTLKVEGYIFPQQVISQLSLAICLLPATRHKWTHRLNPALTYHHYVLIGKNLPIGWKNFPDVCYEIWNPQCTEKSLTYQQLYHIVSSSGLFVCIYITVILTPVICLVSGFLYRFSRIIGLATEAAIK